MIWRLAVCLSLAVALTNGAAVPVQEDVVFDMLQAMIHNPESVADAFGLTRVRRSAYDKEFSLDRLGVNVGIKYIDPSNQAKGGKADITVNNLKKLIPKAKSELVKLAVSFDGGADAKDGLFDMTVDYELHHSNEELGTAHLERTKEGNFWKTKMSVVSKNNPSQKLIPVFEITMKSDRKTVLQGTYKCEHGNDYTLNVDRVPGEKINAVLEGNGKTYIMEGVLDKADKSVKINIDANGLNYEVELDFDNDGEDISFDAKVNLGGSGEYKLEFEAKKDLSGGALKVNFNGRDLVSAKLKGKLNKDDQSAKYELRYSAVGVGEGKLRLGLQGGDKQEFKVQYLPKTGLDLKLELTREKKADHSRHFHGVATRGGETFLEYTNDIVPTMKADSYELNVDSQFDVNEKSVAYPVFCKYGCFTQRTMHAKLYVDRNTPYKLSLDVDLTKDSVSVLTVDMNSRNNPAVFKIVAPRILPSILPTGRESIEFEADHSPGNYLKIKSNTNAISSFKIEKVDGETRRIELNGKELIKAGFTKGDNKITQTSTLPDGRSLTTTISWDSDNLKSNKVHVNLDGTERTLDAHIEWDVTNPAAMTASAKGKGKNARWGEYEISRECKSSFTSSAVSIDWHGDSSFQNSPWPSPVHTEIKGDFDFASYKYNMKLSKNVAGKTYALSVADGKVNLEM